MLRLHHKTRPFLDLHFLPVRLEVILRHRFQGLVFHQYIQVHHVFSNRPQQHALRDRRQTRHALVLVHRYLAVNTTYPPCLIRLQHLVDQGWYESQFYLILEMQFELEYWP